MHELKACRRLRNGEDDLEDGMNDERFLPELRRKFLDALNMELGRYMVALAGSFRNYDREGIPTGAQRFFCFPGFVLALGARWLFVTAGHNMRDLEREYGKAGNNWVGIVWAHFAPGQSDGVLSPDRSRTRWFYYECDVVEAEDCGSYSGSRDWGATELTESEKQWFVGAGVKPFRLNDLSTEFDNQSYIMMGLPVELFEKVSIDDTRCLNSVDPTIIGLRKRDDLIAWMDRQWFVADLPDEADIDIRGMSGGPLFGIDFTGNDGAWELWIAGIQSHWCPAKRIVFVCPIKTIVSGLPFKPQT
jgi:hypothetical protein